MEKRDSLARVVRKPALIGALCLAIVAGAACSGPPARAPRSHVAAAHIPDPARAIPPSPDYTGICGPGLDSSSRCLDAVVAAVDAARALEAVAPMAVPSDFAELSVPEQLFVAVNLERVDRGLRPVAGLTAGLDRNAERGADAANDPPDPGPSYRVVDSEWAGGASNGLDAVYGWMYDDGPGGTNVDCPEKGGSGCWAHRHGVLDDFGTAGTLVMGAAASPSADTNPRDLGGTSMTITLAVTPTPGVLIFKGG